jgi:hypothetical protein
MPGRYGSQSLGSHRDRLRNGPHKRDESTGHGDHDLVRGFAPCTEVPIALAQSHLSRPTGVLDRFGELFPSWWQVPTHCGRIALGPSVFHQGATGMGMPGLGEVPPGVGARPSTMPKASGPDHA